MTAEPFRRLPAAFALAAVMAIAPAGLAFAQSIDCSADSGPGEGGWQAGSPVATPQAVNQAFTEYFNRPDIDALMSLYDDSSVVVAQPGGEPIVGPEGIRGTLGWLISTGGTMTYTRGYCLVQGDIAMLRVDFTLAGGKDAEGKPMEMSGHTAEVVRKAADGTWKYVFDNVFGSN